MNNPWFIWAFARNINSMWLYICCVSKFIWHAQEGLLIGKKESLFMMLIKKEHMYVYT